MITGCFKICLSGIAVVLLFSSSILAQGTLKIVVQNAGPVHGTMRAALYNSAEHFMKQYFQIKEVKVDNENVVIIFDNLPFGEYAFSIFQDVNDNGVLDTNLLGIPREPWGFSNNARGKFGPPDFKAARFIVDGKKEMTILLNR